MSRTIRGLLGLLLGLLILGLWLAFVGIEATLSTLATATPVPAILATLTWILALFLRSWKWHCILTPLQRVPYSTSGRVYGASAFLNVLFPFRAGELARSLFLKQIVEMPIATSLPTVFVDRFYSIAVILVGLLFLPLSPFRLASGPGGGGVISQTSLRWAIGLLAAALVAVLLMLLVLSNQKPRVLRWTAWLARPVPSKLRKRMVGFVDAIIDSMQFVRTDAASTLALLGLSLAVLIADAIKDHFVLGTFGLQVPVVQCFFGVCITNLAFVLPSPPGNIGSNEWYATLVYSTGFGYGSTQVASGALFGHVMTTAIVAGGGALSLSSLGLTLAQGLRISQDRPET